MSVDEAYGGGHRSVTLSGPDGPRNYEVKIPAGVTDGQRIRLAGQRGSAHRRCPGWRPVPGGPDAAHPRFRVDGRDIHVELPLAPWEAALGTSVAVDTPGGATTVKVPPGTSSGRRLRLRRRGMLNPRGDAGDLFAEACIVVPPKLEDEERRLFEELAKISTFDPRRRR